MSVTITKIKDPFNSEINQIDTEPFVEGEGIDYYLRDVVLMDPGINYVLSVNGRIVDVMGRNAVEIQPGDKIAIVARTEAGAIALWITGYAGIGAALSAGVMAAVAYGAVYLAATFVIGYAMSALTSALAPDAPKMNAGGSYGGSDSAAAQIYGWGELYQGSSENARIPYSYGTNKMAGHEINKFVDVEGNKEILNVLMGLCDHEIDSITDIRINDQPYTYFREVEVIADRLGTLADTLIPGFGEIVGQNDVGSKLVYNTAVVQQTDGNAVEKLKITLTAPSGFYYTNDTGGLDTKTATYSIRYRVVGATTWVDFETAGSMSGATTSAVKEVVEIDSLTPAQYEVQVTRTNAELSSFRGCDDVYFSSLQEIVKESLVYPGLAKYAIKALATDQLSGGQPRFSCVTAKNYVSIWDESLTIPAWANKRATNPAWMVWDLLVHRASPGIDKTRMIWDDFKNWADYCDETVAADYRFIVNTVIFDGDFWGQAQRIARLGRGAIIRRGTKYGVFVDKPESVVSHLFTMGNILEGTFKMQYLPQKDRANAVEVEYTDPDKDYTRQVVCVCSNDYLGVDTEGQKAQVSIDAAISEAEAIREGVFRVNSNKYLNRVVTFGAAIDSFGCTVGDLFYFQHEIVDYESKKIGSRILSAGNDDGSGNPFVQLDQAVEIEADTTYKILVRLSDDSLVEKTVNNAVGTTDTLTLTVAWSTVPEKYDIFLFGEAETYKKSYRLTFVDRTDDLTRTLTGIEYVPEIYTANDSYVLDVPTWAVIKQKAIHIILNEFLSYAKDGGYISNINVAWHRAYSRDGANWSIWLEDTTAGTDPIKLGEAYENSFVISKDMIVDNSYKVYVSVKGEGAVDTGDNTQTITLAGKLAPPADVINFVGTWDPIKRQVVFAWSAVSNLDLDYYEIREGSTWASATKVSTSFDNASLIYIDEGVAATKTYRIKAVDKSGIYSDSEDTVAVAIDTSDCALSVPGALALVSSSVIASDGRNIVTLLATWNADAESSDDFHHYHIQLEDMAVNKTSSFSCTGREFQWELIPNKQYGVTVRAVDVSGNVTAYCTQVLHTTVKDTQAPDTPAWQTSNFAIAGFKVIGLNWQDNSEADLSHYVLERSTVSDFASDVTVLGSIKASFHSDQNGLAVSTEYFYRIKAVDTSGNESAYSSIQSATTTLVGTTDIAAAAITASHISVSELSAIAADIGAITAGTLQSSGFVGDDPALEIDLDAGTYNSRDTDKRVSLDTGDLTFYRTFNSVEVTYKSLKRVVSGTASHGDSVELGYFVLEPSVLVSPYSFKCFSADDVAVDQYFSLSATNIREVNPSSPGTDQAGSNYWVFDVSAELVSGAGEGVKSINVLETGTSDATTLTVDKNDDADMTTPVNVTAVSVSVDVKSVRGTGTSGQYYNREATLKLYAGASLETTKVLTTEIAGELGQVRTSIGMTGLTAGSHDVKVTCDYDDDSGTFGSATYEYSSANGSSSPGSSAYADSSSKYTIVSGIAFPNPSTTGWFVYSVSHSVSVSYSLNGSTSTIYPRVGIYSTGDAYHWTTVKGSGVSNKSGSYTFTFTHGSRIPSFWIYAQTTYGGTNATITVTGVSITLSLRRYPSGSTTPDNELEVIEYTYTVAAGSNIDDGVVKWIATGQ